ncbi:hypothetical protein [Salipaludibacillus agaradhaerens]|jgi:hypothetical protein|nr:hypothetical protein [Salipaludibacillus agaradhaerens]
MDANEKQSLILQIYSKVNMSIELLNKLPDEDLKRLYKERVLNG